MWYWSKLEVDDLIWHFVVIDYVACSAKMAELPITKTENATAWMSLDFQSGKRKTLGIF